jgi:hypothetical protein
MTDVHRWVPAVHSFTSEKKSLSSVHCKKNIIVDDRAIQATIYGHLRLIS